jgi:hypothetical protein
VRLTTGLIRSSSKGFVGTLELGTAAECAGTESVLPTTVGEGRGAAGGGGGAAEIAGFGASQVPSGTREAAAAPLTALVRNVFPDEDGGPSVAAEGRGAEGTAGFGTLGAAVLRIAAMSTFPTGV